MPFGVPLVAFGFFCESFGSLWVHLCETFGKLSQLFGYFLKRFLKGSQRFANKSQNIPKSGPAAPFWRPKDNFLKVFGSYWLLLALIGSHSFLLAPIGSYWLLSAPIGSHWLLLAPIGCYWLLLAPNGSYWPLLAPNGS